MVTAIDPVQTWRLRPDVGPFKTNKHCDVCLPHVSSPHHLHCGRRIPSYDPGVYCIARDPITTAGSDTVVYLHVREMTTHEPET